MEKTIYSKLNQEVRDNALTSAIREENELLVKSILKDFDPSQKAKDIALSVACKKGCETIAKWLVEDGANINSIYHPMIEAISSDSVNIVQYLIDIGADVQFNENGHLYDAVSRSNYAISKLLLENGANPNDRPEILITAVKLDNLDLVKLLLKFGANPNSPYTDYRMVTTRPIVEALLNNSYSMVKVLLENGVDVKEEKGILFTAIDKKCDIEIIRLLLENGANPNDAMHSGIQTVLKDAIRTRNIEVVKLLIEYGANVSMFADTCIDSPFDVAVECGNLDVINLLIEEGVDPSNNNVVKAWYDIQKFIIKSGKNIEDYDLTEILNTIKKRKVFDIIQLFFSISE